MLNQMYDESKDGRKRKDVQIGQLVAIVLKKDQNSGLLSEGIIKRVLTNASHHPHGIKVMLDSGEVGRVKHFFSEE